MIAVIGSTKVNIGMKMRLPEPEKKEDFTKSFEEIAAEQQKPEDDEIIAESCGCGFNVAKRLSKDGFNVKFLSVVSNDIIGRAAIEEMQECGIDIGAVKVLDGITPISVQQYNILGDVETDRSNEVLLSEITPEFIDENAAVLNESDIVFIDGSLSRETIEYVAENYGSKDGIKLFFDPAGVKGALKAKAVLDGFYCVLPGRIEAENMTGLTILSEAELEAAGRYFCEKGVSLTIITMKGGGLYFKSGEEEGILRPERIISFAKTRGAGDVVSAAAVAAAAEGKCAGEIGKIGMEKAAEFLANIEDKNYIE